MLIVLIAVDPSIAVDHKSPPIESICFFMRSRHSISLYLISSYVLVQHYLIHGDLCDAEHRIGPIKSNSIPGTCTIQYMLINYGNLIFFILVHRCLIGLENITSVMKRAKCVCLLFKNLHFISILRFLMLQK